MLTLKQVAIIKSTGETGEIEEVLSTGYNGINDLYRISGAWFFRREIMTVQEFLKEA